jgi:hypothetical protein
MVMFRQLPTWLRMVAIGLATLVTLWLVWGVILFLFAFALVPAIVIATVASLFVMLGAYRLAQATIRSTRAGSR